MGSRLRGVVFDLDGVLLDSEPLHRDAIRHVLAPLGVFFDDDEYASEWMGLDDHTLIARVFAKRGREIGEEHVRELATAKTDAFAAVIEEGIEPARGALELLRNTRETLPVALCSGSRRREIDLILDSLGTDVPGLFVTTVSADDVARSKPDPEGYRKAVAALGLEPEVCLAIEDTPTGIRAARSAGLRVLGVDTLSTPERLTDADRITTSLADVRLDDLHRILDQAP